MKEITTQALVQKLGARDVRLIMTMTADHYAQGHIPGSEYFDDLAAGMASIDPTEAVIVYCSDPACAASIRAYEDLENAGYSNVTLYRGGLSGWVDAGYSLATGSSS